MVERLVHLIPFLVDGGLLQRPAQLVILPGDDHPVHHLVQLGHLVDELGIDVEGVADVFRLDLVGLGELGVRRFQLGVALLNGRARLVQAQVAVPEFAHVQAAAIADALGPRYRVLTWQDEDRVLFDALRTEKTMMFILLAFIAVVAAFCVTNTLIVITIQKTREIGLLKALGFSAGQIRSAFVLGGLVQCVAGEALGFGLGWLVLHNLQCLVAWLASMGVEVFPKSVYGLAEIPWRIVPTDVAAVIGTVFVFCFAASFLPAWLAARLDPVRAINQE